MITDPATLPPLYDAPESRTEHSPELYALLVRLRAVVSNPATPLTRIAWIDAILREYRV